MLSLRSFFFLLGDAASAGVLIRVPSDSSVAEIMKITASTIHGKAAEENNSIKKVFPLDDNSLLRLSPSVCRSVSLNNRSGINSSRSANPPKGFVRNCCFRDVSGRRCHMGKNTQSIEGRKTLKLSVPNMLECLMSILATLAVVSAIISVSADDHSLIHHHSF